MDSLLPLIYNLDMNRLSVWGMWPNHKYAKVYWQQSGIFYEWRANYIILNKYEKVKHMLLGETKLFLKLLLYLISVPNEKIQLSICVFCYSFIYL